MIGAGIAGLVAAYQLQKKGIDVLVLEASTKAGGRMQTDSTEGYIIDGGAQFLSSAYSILPRLITELGIISEFVETSTSIGIVRNGKIRKFKYDKPFTLLSGGLLSFKEWLSLGVGSFRLIAKTKKLRLNDYSAWNIYDNETVEIWANRYYGKNVTEYFIEPLLEAFYFQSPKDTSKALSIALNAFGAHKARTMTLTTGIGKLPELIGKKLNILFSTPVDKVYIENDKVIVVSGQSTFKANKIVLATPAPSSKKIYKDVSLIESLLLNTKYSSTINIAFALKKELSRKANLDKIYGVWIPLNERKIIAAFTIETAKNYKRATSGELVNVMLSGKFGKSMMLLSDEKIITEVLLELNKYIPNITRHISFTKIYRWPNAEPMSPVGRSKNLLEYRSTIKKGEKILLAGDYLSMPFSEGAAESGLWAATTILNQYEISGND